jgi:hypothetical protein
VSAYNRGTMQVITPQNHANRNMVLLHAMLGSVLLMATGCSGVIVGDWHMTKAIPNKQVFAIEDACFARDGTFTATVTIEGKTVREKGEYDFNGFKLTMRPQGGGQRRYNTVLKGRTLEIHDEERKVFLRKGKKSEKQ